MKRITTALLLAFAMITVAFGGSAHAQQAGQDTVWIQIAARPSLAEAQEEAQDFAARLPDVAGFTLGAGW